MAEQQSSTGVPNEDCSPGWLGGWSDELRLATHSARIGLRCVHMSRANPSREAAEALRAAVDKTFQSTVDQASASRDRAQNRAQDIVDELSQAAGRVRDALDDLRVATREDLKELSDRLGTIESRLTALEAAPAAKPAARKPAAKKPAVRKPAAKKPAAAAKRPTKG